MGGRWAIATRKEELLDAKAHDCCRKKKSEIRRCIRNTIKHVTLWSDWPAQRQPGNPPLSRRALFPADLCSLIKTNRGGILHADSIQHPGELSHLIWVAASPTPLSAAHSRGLANLIVLTLAWLREGNSPSELHTLLTPLSGFGLKGASRDMGLQEGRFYLHERSGDARRSGCIRPAPRDQTTELQH